MKRVLNLALLLLALSVANATVINEIDYKLDIDNGVAEILDILSSAESLTIPDTLEYYGYKFAVKRIHSIKSCKVKELRLPNTLRDTIRYGMLTNTYLEKVYCPPHITKMDSAFRDCKKLQEVELPDSLKYADYLFSGCNSLKSCKMPDNVETLLVTFWNCTSLNTLVLPKNLKTISYRTFSYCTSLKDIILPEGLENIEGGFEYSTSIKSLYIPNSVRRISVDVFKDSDIESINIPTNLEIENSKSSNFLLSLKKLKEVTIDDNDKQFIINEDVLYWKNGDKYEMWYAQGGGVLRLPTYEKIKIDASVIKNCLSELIVSKECLEFELTTGSFEWCASAKKNLHKLKVEDGENALAIYVAVGNVDAVIDEIYIGRSITPLNGNTTCFFVQSSIYDDKPEFILKLGKYAGNVNMDNLYKTYYNLGGTIAYHVDLHIGYGPTILEFGADVEEIIPNFRLNFVEERKDYGYKANKVHTVRCYSKVPPECENLNKLTSIDAKLCVPKGTWSAYITHPFWGMFTDITEMEVESGIDEVKIQEEIDATAVEVERYDVNGRILGKPISGLNIVKLSNGKVKKEFVR